MEGIMGHIKKRNRELADSLKELVECEKCNKKWKGERKLAKHAETCEVRKPEDDLAKDAVVRDMEKGQQ